MLIEKPWISHLISSLSHLWRNFQPSGRERGVQCSDFPFRACIGYLPNNLPRGMDVLMIQSPTMVMCEFPLRPEGLECRSLSFKLYFLISFFLNTNLPPLNRRLKSAYTDEAPIDKGPIKQRTSLTTYSYTVQ
jgi:hypothetical protein